MKQRFRSIAILLSIALVAVSALALTPARAQDTAAVAVNTRDDSSIFRLAFQIRRTMNEVVDASNGAAAVSSCESCETVALAYQVVLVFSDPEVVTPENVALALNIECTLCETMASAYQYVLTTGGPVHLSAEANQQIAKLRLRLKRLRTSDLTMEEMIAEADAIADELFAVIDAGLVSGPASDQDGEETATTTPSPESSPTETATEETPAETTPTPEETSTSSPTDGSSPTAEPSPEESSTETSPSPEPSPS